MLSSLPNGLEDLVVSALIQCALPTRYLDLPLLQSPVQPEVKPPFLRPNFPVCVNITAILDPLFLVVVPPFEFVDVPLQAAQLRLQLLLLVVPLDPAAGRVAPATEGQAAGGDL